MLSSDGRSNLREAKTDNSGHAKKVAQAKIIKFFS